MDVRVSNKPDPDGRDARPYHGSLFIDDGTGFVSAATPTAEVVDAAPVTIGVSPAPFGFTGAVASGRLTLDGGGNESLARPGNYKCTLSIGDILSGNASVVTVEVYKNGAVLAAAGPGAIKAKMTFAGTAVQMCCHASGNLSLDAGDYVDVRVTGSVGTVTIKNMHLELTQLSDD